MSKKDVRVYFDSDYAEYLKQLADEQDVSVNHLIVTLVRKKYPMPKSKKQPALDDLSREKLKQRLDDLDKLIENAKSIESAKIQPKSAFMFLLKEQKEIKELLGE